MKRNIIRYLPILLFLVCIQAAECFASEAGICTGTLSVIDRQLLLYSWGLRISQDTTEGECMTENLGMDKVTRQKVIKTIEDNWTEGLKYCESSYSINHQDSAACVNYGNRQYAGREKKGYGYNCTGFVASVLYYANGGSMENAYAEMKELYRPLQKRSGSFTNGTGWYNYVAEGQKAETDSQDTPKTRVYYMGEITDPDSIQSALSAAEQTGRLKTGYILYFWPSTGWDCHLGIYAGRDSNGIHQMYHAAGRGNHNGVRLTEHVVCSQALSEGPSYLYILPLPESPAGWQDIDGKRYHFYADGEMTYRWSKEGSKWFYFDPVTGEMAAGLKTIDDRQYYFFKDGRMARYIMLGKLIFDRNGVCVDLRKYE